MCKITVRNTMTAKEIIAESTISVNEAFERAGVDIGTGIVNILGTPVSTAEYDTPINKLVGEKEKYIVASVVKGDCGC